MARLRIPLEFSENNPEEMELYKQLKRHSCPAAYIKDVLRGLCPIPGATTIAATQVQNNSDDLDEDIMDF